MANALRYHPDYDVVETQEAIQTLFDMDIDIVAPTRELLNKTIDIAVADNVTCYDTLYLALAEDVGEDFVTADEKLLSRLSGSRKNMAQLLKEL